MGMGGWLEFQVDQRRWQGGPMPRWAEAAELEKGLFIRPCAKDASVSAGLLLLPCRYYFAQHIEKEFSA
jgi:hypothetical protein